MKGEGNKMLGKETIVEWYNRQGWFNKALFGLFSLTCNKNGLADLLGYHEETGFCGLDENHPLINQHLQPLNLDLKGRHFSYGKCEPETVAKRFVMIQIAEKLPFWMAMSLRKYFAGNDRLNKKEYKRLLSKLPDITEEEEEGPNFEVFPPSPNKENLFHICGLNRLRRLGVIEIREIDGKDYIIPTKRLLDDINKMITA